MASVQKKGDAWYCQFVHSKKRHTFAVGRVTRAEADRVADRVGYLLMRLKQGLLEVPLGVDVADFVRFDGRPPKAAEVAAGAEPVQKSVTLGGLRDAYLGTVGGGAVEANTLSTTRVHFAHLVGTFGADLPLAGVGPADLQRHVDRRQAAVAPVTVRKELATLRTAWAWGLTMGHLREPFPAGKLVYRKDDEKLPFMTWAEVARRLAAGGDRDALRECLYLDTTEVEELLAFVRTARGPDWLYPMFCLAAHTGMRRSELIRAKPEDVDFAAGVVTIREKKRVKGRHTTRRVPLTEFAEAVLREWVGSRPGAAFLFGKGERMIGVQAAQELFRAAVRGSKWEVLNGYHTLRHSFVSACASHGVDQRLVQEWCGHMDEKTSRRYRHLWPSTQRDAIRRVFAPAGGPPAGSAAVPRA